MEEAVLKQGNQWKGGTQLLEKAASLLALSGVLIASLAGFQVRTWQDSGSDFKTLYASAKCFLAGVYAYDFHNIGEVFHTNGIVQPASWYAHAPTYPPFTFALLAPVIAFPMVQAVYIWMALSSLALLFAMWSMIDYSKYVLALGPGWRLAIVALVAASPLVSFGLQVGNVSVVASAFCIVVVLSRSRNRYWLAGLLTVSFLLKPHIALWLLVGMFVSKSRADRSLAVLTGVVVVGILLLFAACSVTFSHGLQLHDYLQMVKNEVDTGCLNPRNHELLPPFAEITSLQSFFGFFLDSPWLQIMNVSLLSLMFAALLFVTRSKRLGDNARIEVLGAWSTFGLLVTYHRTHDAIILFFLLPWLLNCLRNHHRSLVAWSVLILGIAMSYGSFPPPGFSWLAQLGMPQVSEFLIFRQSASAMLLLMLVLLVHLVHRAATSLDPMQSKRLEHSSAY